MAFWSKKQPEFAETDEAINQKPGLTQAELARNLKVSRSTIVRRLPSMEEAGYLYYEDQKGGLWPFGKQE